MHSWTIFTSPFDYIFKIFLLPFLNIKFKCNCYYRTQFIQTFLLSANIMKSKPGNPVSLSFLANFLRQCPAHKHKHTDGIITSYLCKKNVHVTKVTSLFIFYNKASSVTNMSQTMTAYLHSEVEASTVDRDLWWITQEGICWECKAWWENRFLQTGWQYTNRKEDQGEKWKTLNDLTNK